MDVNKISRNLAEQELYCISQTFDWLDDYKIEQLPGPIAFEYKCLKEYTQEGNIEASLWKLVNLSNVTLSYLFAVALEKNTDLNGRVFGDSQERDPSVRRKIQIIRNLKIGKELNLLLNSVKEIADWRNYYGTGHGVLLRKQTYYIDSEIIYFYKKLVNVFKEFPDILRGNNLSLFRVHNSNTAGPLNIELNGSKYFEKFEGNEWGGWLVCDRSTIVDANSAAIRFYGYQYDLPDIYFFESLFNINNQKRFTFRNYSQNRIKLCFKDDVAWEDEPRQIAWLYEDERNQWWDYYHKNSNTGNKEKCINILVDAAEKFHLIGMYKEAIKCANEVLKHKVEPEHFVKSNLVLYSSNVAEGNIHVVLDFLHSAKEMASQIKETDKEKGILLNTQIRIQESWYMGVSRENAKKAIKICEEGIEEIKTLKVKFPFSALMLELELWKNWLYIWRDLDDRDSFRLREVCLKVLDNTREVYSIDPENRRNTDIYGFICNHYRQHSCDLIEQQKLDRKEIEVIEKIIDEGFAVREKSFNKFDMDIWSVRGYAWSIHDKARFLMVMKNDYTAAEELLKISRDLRLKYFKSFPDDKGVLVDLVKNYADLYKAEGQLQGNRKEELSKKASSSLRKIREVDGESERFKSLRKVLEDSGLQYIY